MTASRTSRAALLGKHFLASPWRSPLVAGVVALAAFLLVAAPQAVGAAATAELRARVDAIPGPARDLVADAPGALPLGPGASDRLPAELADVFGATEAALADIREGAGPRLAPQLGEADYVAITTPFPMLDPDAARDAPILALRLAVDPVLPDRVRLVEGEFPEVIDLGAGPVDAPLPVMLSVASAERMDWSVGEVRRVPDPQLTVPVVLTGTFEPVDPEARVWSHAASVVEPEVQDDGNSPPRVTGVGYIAAETFAASTLVNRWRLTAWFPFDPDGLDVERGAALAAELRRFTQAPHELPEPAEPIDATMVGALSFDSAVLPTIDAVLARSTTSTALLALTGSGPFGVVLAILALTATAVVEARRPTLVLAASRGASARTLRTALGLEGALVGLPAAALGAVLALLLVPGPVSALALVGAALLGLAPAAVFAARATPPLRRPVRVDLGARARGPLRVVAEVLVVGVAVLATVLLVTRGPLTDAGDIDPLAVCAPIALAVAAALLLRRLLPLPLVALQRRARRGTGVAAFVGLARAVREPLAAVASLALVVAVGVTVFSSIMLTTIATGTNAAVRGEIGADVRVEGPFADQEDLDALAAIPGVAIVAGVDAAGSATITADGDRNTADLLLVDAAALRELHPELPEAFREVGEDDPLPVLVSPDLRAELRGTELEVADVAAESLGAPPQPIGLGGGAWVAVDRSAAERLGAGAYNPRTILLALEPGGNAGDVAAGAVEVLGPSARPTTIGEALAEAAEAPTLGALRAGFGIAVALAAVLVGLAVVLAAIVTTARRRELAARLSLVGASPRQLVGVVATESAPPAVAALLVGALLGAALPWIVVAGTDLAPLVGGETAPAVTADPLALTGILGAALLITAGSLLPALLPVLRRPRRGTT